METDPHNLIYGTLHKQDIRLLTLLPGPVTAPIECRLTVVSFLRETPEYEALSYVWGDQSDPQMIRLHGHPFKVGKNLYRALIRLRYPVEARIIWIDALCINQKNIAECEQQVLLMGMVYSRTTNCIIWLGEFFESGLENRDWGNKSNDAYITEFPTQQTTEDAKITFTGEERDLLIIKNFENKHYSFSVSNAFHRLTKQDLRFWPYLGAFCLLRSMADDTHWYDLACCTQFLGRTMFPSVLEALTNILGAPWWYRAWTVQEAVLPSTLTVILGSISMPFEIVLKARQNMIRHIHYCCDKWMRALPMEERHLITSRAILSNSELIELKKEYHHPNSSVIGGRVCSEMMSRFRPRLATKAHDKVYSLLGLFSDEWRNTPLLKPEYKLPAGHVYARASFIIFQLEDSLDFLAYCDGHSPADFLKTTDLEPPTKTSTLERWREYQERLKERRHKYAKEISLPSWVPHWTGSMGENPSTMDFKASSSVQETPQLLSNTELSVVARKIDKVVWTAETFDNLQMGKILKDLRDKINSEGGFERFYPDGSLVEDAFLRTILRDRCLAGAGGSNGKPSRNSGMFYRLPKEADLQRVKAIILDISNSWDPDSADINYLSQVQGKIRYNFDDLSGQTFFITETGYFGLACGDIAINDEAFIIIGANFPFILRRNSVSILEDGVLESPSYQLIGRCYLHGIMNGEAMADYAEKRDGTRITLA